MREKLMFRGSQSHDERIDWTHDISNLIVIGADIFDVI